MDKVLIMKLKAKAKLRIHKHTMFVCVKNSVKHSVAQAYFIKKELEFLSNNNMHY